MRRPLMAVCMCFAVVMSLLLLTGSFRLSEEESCLLEDLTGRRVTVTGHVYRKDAKYFYLNSVKIQNHAVAQQQFISLTKNVICEYDGTAPRIGSTIEAAGSFEVFERATNPGEFDAAEYYSSIKICGRVRKITTFRESSDFCRWKEALFSLQQFFRKRLYHIFPPKEASVMCAMLLGDKEGLDEGVKQLYQENGIIHILAISGLHITIIGMSIYRLLRSSGVPVWIAAILGSTVLLAYGIMTGMSVSACRAIGMFLIKMLAEMVGRTYDMLTALAVMAAGMIGANPLCLKNAGFLLSYGAILGIGVLYPALSDEDVDNRSQRKVQQYEEKRWKSVWRKFAASLGKELKASMLSGLSVTLVTMPIQLWFYYEVPTYSVLINLLVLPFMNMVMLSGMAAMLVPGLGLVGTIDCMILSGYEWLCGCFGALPRARWNPGRPQSWQLVMYYGLLLAMLLVEAYRRDRSGKGRSGREIAGKKKYGSYIMLLAAVVLLGIRGPQTATVAFLDVGQGDCICMRLSTGEVYLFDCGSLSRSRVGEYVLYPYLKYNGIRHIDAVFVSHDDADHSNGVEELLNQHEEWGISIGRVFWGDAMQNGACWESEGCRFLCLHPPRNSTISDSNANSQCFYIEMEEGFSLLLTGDVEAEGEEMLLEELKERGIERVSVLKVAHHGSRNSSGEKFLEQAAPKAALISCGKNNSYGHPHKETLKRLEEAGAMVMTTADCGAVEVEVGRKIRIKCFMPAALTQ